ncbi:hypothetical protein [Mycobacterium florentinum]|uniref:hypothetical protein n=1 Tax=Mycobacterium florentinum TaxID=292462 RepID=UPI001E61C546|nr:hypothetical protein [Mycobacterium florentinum]
MTRHPSGLRSGHGSSNAGAKLPRISTSKAIGACSFLSSRIRIDFNGSTTL